jgi:thiol-disulfide isomerase/thioredoxin
MAKIFISYSRASKDVIEEMIQDLTDDGQETWFDQHLTGGQRWWDNILSEIRECEVFVAALTPDFLESKACQREMKYAKDLLRTLLPIRLSDKVLPEPAVVDEPVALPNPPVIDQPAAPPAPRLAGQLVTLTEPSVVDQTLAPPDHEAPLGLTGNGGEPAKWKPQAQEPKPISATSVLFGGGLALAVALLGIFFYLDSAKKSEQSLYQSSSPDLQAADQSHLKTQPAEPSPSNVRSPEPSPPNVSSAEPSSLNLNSADSGANQAVIGNPNGKITLVEFFDYNCGYCKRALTDLARLMKHNPDLRVVLRDFPILSPGSVDAARVANAFLRQFQGEKFWEFHQKLLGSHGRVGKAEALADAKFLGADMDKLANDAAAPGITAGIEESDKLAKSLQVTGTPSYVIGDDVVVGAGGLRRIAVQGRQYKKVWQSDLFVTPALAHSCGRGPRRQERESWDFKPQFWRPGIYLIELDSYTQVFLV